MPNRRAARQAIAIAAEPIFWSRRSLAVLAFGSLALWAASVSLCYGLARLL